MQGGALVVVHQADGSLAPLGRHTHREQVVVVRRAAPRQLPVQPKVQLRGWDVEEGERIQSACWVVQASCLQVVRSNQRLVSRSVPSQSASEMHQDIV